MLGFKSIGDWLRGGASDRVARGNTGAAGLSDQAEEFELLARAQQNATVATCVGLIAKAIGQIDFQTRDPYWQAAFERPNPLQSKYEFWSSVAWDSCIFGNAFIHRSDGRGSAGMLAPLDPTLIRVTGTMATPRYERSGGGQAYGPKRIIHLRNGGGSGVLAVGPVSAGWKRIKALDACDMEIQNVFRNGLNLSYVLHGGSADADLRNAIVDAVTDVVGPSSSTRGGVVCLPGEFKLDAIKGITPADSDLRNLRSDLIREIAALFGIPPFAAGGSSDTKYSNVVARHAQVAKEALLPLAETISQKFSHALGIEVTFNSNDVLKGDFATKMELMLKSCGGAAFTPDEARREFWGWDAVEGGGELRGAEMAESNFDDRRGEMPADGSGSDR